MPRDQRLYMTFPIDFWKHEKVRRLSDAAFRAFVEANGHSRIRESDGVLEAPDAEFIWDASALQELCKSHPTRPLLYSEGEGDARVYVIRDYAEHQFTKSDRDELSEKRRKAAEKRWSNASAEQVHSKPMQADAEIGIGKGIDTSSSTKKRGAGTRGTRIPEPFMLTAEMKQWAADEVPAVDADASTRRFVDYWRAESGTKATKLDWIATWRNWLRRDADSKKPTRLTPTERAAQTAAAGRQVAGRNITSLEIEQ